MYVVRSDPILYTIKSRSSKLQHVLVRCLRCYEDTISLILSLPSRTGKVVGGATAAAVGALFVAKRLVRYCVQRL